MQQITVRAEDELIERVRMSARAARRSMNEFVTTVLDAATNPELAGDEAERLRSRLSLAGLLADAPTARHSRPDKRSIAAARRRAAQGTPLSEFVRAQR